MLIFQPRAGHTPPGGHGEKIDQIYIYAEKSGSLEPAVDCDVNDL